LKLVTFRLQVILSAIFLVCMLWVTTYAANLERSYSPTRREWLEISIFKVIKERTDSWQQRTGFLVWVVEKENTVFITLSSANGQEETSKEAKERYIEAVRGDVELFIKKYEWSKSLKVFVQYL
jgi:hypothetical protein